MPGPGIGVSFPYNPSSGFSPEELQGPGIRPDDRNGALVNASQETKDRLKKIGFSALDILLEGLAQRVRPAPIAEKPVRAPEEAGTLIPTIRIEGPAQVKATLTGKVALGILGALLVVAILKEGGIRGAR